MGSMSWGFFLVQMQCLPPAIGAVQAALEIGLWSPRDCFGCHIMPAKTTRVLGVKSFEADEEDAGEVPIFWDARRQGRGRLSARSRSAKDQYAITALRSFFRFLLHRGYVTKPNISAGELTPWNQTGNQ
jgi:hypothetical protein